MARVEKRILERPPFLIALVLLYDMVLVVATVAAMFYVTPWAILMLLALADPDEEEVIIEAENEEELARAMEEELK